MEKEHVAEYVFGDTLIFTTDKNLKKEKYIEIICLEKDCIICIEKIIFSKFTPPNNNIFINNRLETMIDFNLLRMINGFEETEDSIIINCFPDVFGYFYIVSEKYKSEICLDSVNNRKDYIRCCNILYKILDINTELNHETISVLNIKHPLFVQFSYSDCLFSIENGYLSLSGVFVSYYENIKEIMVNGICCNDVFKISPLVAYVSFNGVNYDKPGENVVIESFSMKTIDNHNVNELNLLLYFIKNNRIYVSKCKMVISEKHIEKTHDYEKKITETYEINNKMVEINHFINFAVEEDFFP